mmetsp:Transcript_108555/g.208652  ORF Transcript_108555/g.208652 Transcript_108555/m.208652 type:complete len:268 (-) Transcript_108555:97-900(-)
MCNVSNQIEWNGTGPVPQANHSCWLLPCEDRTAEKVAEMREELEGAGWKLLTCEPEMVAKLCNKSALRDLAEEIGKIHALPAHWKSPAEATYPCILKAAFGVHGDGTWIVNSEKEALEVLHENGGDLGSDWVIQELVQGSTEYSTSLLVVEGLILDAICMVYEYNSRAYVWPHEVTEERKYSTDYIPARHLATMSAFMRNFTGICNFNYKFRGGRLVIFEVNPRVGGDLVFDVPKDRARMLFEKLDTLSAREQVGGSVEHQDATHGS